MTNIIVCFTTPIPADVRRMTRRPYFWFCRDCRGAIRPRDVRNHSNWGCRVRRHRKRKG